MDNLTIDLRRFDEIPDALYTCAPTELESVLGGPSLFFVEGRQSSPLFVTVLQHGNEPTGFEAVQAILNKYRCQLLPRSMWLFIANVAAAKKRQRVLNGQTDYNRAWPGTLVPDSCEAKLMQQVVETVTAKPLFASIDLHNNTGTNPHYACLNELDPPFLHLAASFARTTVYYRQPVGTQSLAMAKYCPAVTLECGKAGEDAALDHAAEYLEACLHMQNLPDHALAKGGIILLKTQAIVKMKPGIDFGFDGTSEVRFRDDLDHFNFGVLNAGQWLADMTDCDQLPITATTDNGEDIAYDLFEIQNNRLITRNDIIPSMATLDVDIIKQDCLFYVMQEITAT
ncbi:M14 family metallopeptidase [Parasphingorhabdus halotolerans]|uniref:Peptidase M14 n=1 Tax=Parasphingorhabdus halotolerans TaxID=2725558 RepID=A0A6H2DNQ7_9SPHN|nr:M14 family metallopeptidase [Parasphingorhabdus halotolerans]QJB70302.1 peptidase M14 [Parasphingorhabdus halotolerans]